MAWLKRRNRGANAVATTPASTSPKVLVASPGGPTISWPGCGEPAVFVVAHDALAGENRDDPAYLGLGARASIFVNLSARLCPGLDELGKVLPRNGARLYPHAHRTGRFAFLRLNLALGGLAHGFATAISLADGNVQEFPAVACQTGVVELHLSRESEESVLSRACAAGDFRPVADRALAGPAGAEHPATAGEHSAFASGLPSAPAAVNDDLDPAAAIPLTVTESVPSFVALEVLV